MRMMIKRLLRNHRYPPEGMEDAVQTVMMQCELWTDNSDLDEKTVPFRKSVIYEYEAVQPSLAAEEPISWERKE